jgi:Zn-dependent metalloprotease
MKHLLLSLSLILFLSINILQAQSFYGSDAKAYIKNASEIHLNSKTNQIDYIQFDIDKQLDLNKLQLWITKQFQLSDIAKLIEINRTTDKLNQTHIRYKLGVNNVPIHDAMIIAHIKENKVFAINGIVQ